jgi:hypothetical protein
MKTFQQFIEEMNDNVDPADIRRMYMKLKNKAELDPMEQKKLETLRKHPAIAERK